MALIHNLLGSIGALTDMKINNFEKDKIIEAKIVKTPKEEDKDKTIYYVSYQENKYMKVYTKSETDIYNIDDTVYIRIPDGDMTNRKIIDGKVVNYLANEGVNVSSDTSDYQLAIRANSTTDKTILEGNITEEEETEEPTGIIYHTIKIEDIYKGNLDYTNIDAADINFNIELNIENTNLHISNIASIGINFYHKQEAENNQENYENWNENKEKGAYDISLGQGYSLTGFFINNLLMKFIHTEYNIKLNRSIDKIDLIIKLQRKTIEESSYKIENFIGNSIISNIDFKLYKNSDIDNTKINNYCYPYNILNIDKTYLIPLFTKDNQDYLINSEAASIQWFRTGKQIVDNNEEIDETTQISIFDILNNNYYLDDPENSPIEKIQNSYNNIVNITPLEKEIMENYHGIFLDEDYNYLARFTSYLGYDSYFIYNQSSNQNV